MHKNKLSKYFRFLRVDNLTSDALGELANLAEHAAKKAGAFIASVDVKTINVERKNSGSSLASQVVTEIDRQAEAIIYQCLAPSLKTYNLAWLAEESASQAEVNQHDRFGKPAFWCVDPLDGTLAFTENREGYAVSIALVSRSGVPLIGVVYDPSTTQCWNSLSVNGFLVDQTVDQTKATDLKDSLTFVCDRSQLSSASFHSVEQKLHQLKSELQLNSLIIKSDFGAVKNALSVLQTPNALYFKPVKPQAGGGALWDFAATTALFNAAKKPCDNALGKPINFNQADSLYLNQTGILYCSDEHIKEVWLALN